MHTQIDDGVLVVVGGHCRGTCHRDVFVLDFGVSPPAWRQLRPENGAPALSGHTATVLRAPGAALRDRGGATALHRACAAGRLATALTQVGPLAKLAEPLARIELK